MLSLALPSRIFVCTLPTDMRKSFDSLAALVQTHLDQDPLSLAFLVSIGTPRLLNVAGG